MGGVGKKPPELKRGRFGVTGVLLVQAGYSAGAPNSEKLFVGVACGNKLIRVKG